MMLLDWMTKDDHSKLKERAGHPDNQEEEEDI